MISVVTAATLVAYSVYTISSETAARLGSDRAVAHHPVRPLRHLPLPVPGAPAGRRGQPVELLLTDRPPAGVRRALGGRGRPGALHAPWGLISAILTDRTWQQISIRTRGAARTSIAAGAATIAEASDDRRPSPQPQGGSQDSQPEQVDVDQIVKEIKARISQRHGIDLSAQQIQELAARRLEAILDPRTVKPGLLDQLRKSGGSAGRHRARRAARRLHVRGPHDLRHAQRAAAVSAQAAQPAAEAVLQSQSDRGRVERPGQGEPGSGAPRSGARADAGRVERAALHACSSGSSRKCRASASRCRASLCGSSRLPRARTSPSDASADWTSPAPRQPCQSAAFDVPNTVRAGAHRRPPRRVAGARRDRPRQPPAPAPAARRRRRRGPGGEAMGRGALAQTPGAPEGDDDRSTTVQTATADDAGETAVASAPDMTPSPRRRQS